MCNFSLGVISLAVESKIFVPFFHVTLYIYLKVLIFQHRRNLGYTHANLCIGGHLEPSALKFPQHNEDLLQSQPHDHVAPEKKKMALTSNTERRAIIHCKVLILYKDTYIHPIFLLFCHIIICLHTVTENESHTPRK